MAPLPYWPSSRTTAWPSCRDCAFADTVIALPGLSELSARVAVACPRCPGEGTYPLLRVCLQNGRARADHFAPLAPRIARSADLIQSALGRRKIRCARQGSLE